MKAQTENELLALWRAEEEIAHIHGWDFSHIEGRYAEETDFPWDYRQKVLDVLKPGMQLMDMDTGGGEFLLGLGHPYQNTAATEGYPPNVALCERILLPLGVDFRKADAGKDLPFESGRFELVTNRHGDFNVREIYRVLKPGGVFITQQVGAENDRELVSLLLPNVQEKPFSQQYVDIAKKKFEAQGFDILEAQECFGSMRFFDVGALVWFARIIQWEFPGFSVDAYREQLLNAHQMIEKQGFVEGKTHRFFLMARKPE